MTYLRTLLVSASVVGGAVAQVCEDLKINGAEWNDSDGATYNCGWYSNGDRCERYGDDYSNTYTANEACCACDGGGVAPPEPSCVDTLLSTGEPWFTDDAASADYTCDFFSADPTRCVEYGEGNENEGMTAKEACCACGGGEGEDGTASPTASPTPVPTPAPTLSPVPAPIDIPARGGFTIDGGCADFTLDNSTLPDSAWHDSDGPEYSCAWYSQGSNCQQYGNLYANEGLTARYACCACGGGMTLPIAIDQQVWDLNKITNEAAHHTAFQSGGTSADLLLRRGDEFVVTRTDSSTSAVSFTLGSENIAYVDTMPLPSVRSGSSHTVGLPVNLPVGRYVLFADGEAIGRVVVLFNPWCTQDTVYMADAQERAEYVQGVVAEYFYGNVYGYRNGRLEMGWAPWQMDTDSILDDVLDLLELTVVDWEDRSTSRTSMDFADPVKVSRALSYMGSSSAPSGVVQGRWDGTYDDCEECKGPGHWTGTKEIMDLWQEQGQQPIKYGQCWVFACTLTSFMRSLGVPARVIGNFNSAHEVPTGFISTAYGRELNYDWKIDDETADSIWNFHEWVNVWMTRPDLDAAGIGATVPHAAGWNDIDSTPQETSDGKYQMGPANHADMKANYVKGNAYDTRFTIGEYNSNSVQEGDEWIGRYTFTKSVAGTGVPGCSGARKSLSSTSRLSTYLAAGCVREISTETKTEPSSPPEQTETLGLRRLLSSTKTKSTRQAKDHEQYMKNDFHAHAVKPEVGEDLVVVIYTHHIDTDMNNYKVSLKLQSIAYTGTVLEDSQVYNVQGVRSGNADRAVITVPYETYKTALKGSLDFRGLVKVKSVLGGAKKKESLRFRFSMAAPAPQLSVDGNMLTVSWSNPMHEAIHGLDFAVNGPTGIVNDVTLNELGARETYSFTIEVECRPHGGNTVIVALTTDEVLLGFSHASLQLDACA